jgi:5'-deoxynucleotidase YfbR-like HD superfamily hydrolase
MLSDPDALPEELREISEQNPAVLVGDARRIEAALKQLSPEQKENVETGLHNFGYKLEQLKNGTLANVFSRASEMIGTEGLQSTKGSKGIAARFIAGLSTTYKERNEDLDKRMEKIEESRKNGGMILMQKAGSTMQVTGGLLRYGRIAADAIGWTAAAPLRFGQLTATLAETGFKAAKEARFQNEDPSSRC